MRLCSVACFHSPLSELPPQKCRDNYSGFYLNSRWLSVQGGGGGNKSVPGLRGCRRPKCSALWILREQPREAALVRPDQLNSPQTGDCIWINGIHVFKCNSWQSPMACHLTNARTLSREPADVSAMSLQRLRHIMTQKLVIHVTFNHVYSLLFTVLWASLNKGKLACPELPPLRVKVVVFILKAPYCDNFTLRLTGDIKLISRLGVNEKQTELLACYRTQFKQLG